MSLASTDPVSPAIVLTTSTAQPAADAAPRRVAPGPPVDQTRFLGSGLLFKGKLIGLENVPESRGDKMCVISMAKLKAVVLAIKEHKRPIIVGVSLEGIKISDEKTEEILHTHPVSRISFIYRDTTDARAFGYIFSREDGIHQFFAVKTERPAEGVVNSLKELFEVVYHRNKKATEANTVLETEKAPSETKTDNGLAKTGGSGQQEASKIPETKVSPPSDELLNFGNINPPASVSTPSNAWLVAEFGGQDASAVPVGFPAAEGGLKPPQQNLFSPPFGQMNTQQLSAQQQQIAWQQQQQQQHSFNSFSVPTNGPMTGFVSPAAGAWPSPATISAGPQAQSQGGQVNGWPSFDTSIHSDSFTSSTPASAAVGINRLMVSNNLSGTFDSSVSVQTSTSQTWGGGVFGEGSSASGSGTTFGASATINEGFMEPTMSLLQPMSAVKIQQGPPLKVDPFADFGVLLSSTSSQGGMSKKASKEDFLKEGPKQTLFDLSQSQNQSSSSNPFGVTQSNSYGAAATDDPFA